MALVAALNDARYQIHHFVRFLSVEPDTGQDDFPFRQELVQFIKEDPSAPTKLCRIKNRI
jgi:hypothetical protein